MMNEDGFELIDVLGLEVDLAASGTASLDLEWAFLRSINSKLKSLANDMNSDSVRLFH